MCGIYNLTKFVNFLIVYKNIESLGTSQDYIFRILMISGPNFGISFFRLDVSR